MRAACRRAGAGLLPATPTAACPRPRPLPRGRRPAARRTASAAPAAMMPWSATSQRDESSENRHTCGGAREEGAGGGAPLAAARRKGQSSRPAACCSPDPLPLRAGCRTRSPGSRPIARRPAPQSRIWPCSCAYVTRGAPGWWGSSSATRSPWRAALRAQLRRGKREEGGGNGKGRERVARRGFLSRVSRARTGLRACGAPPRAGGAAVPAAAAIRCTPSARGAAGDAARRRTWR
jgi:hypothetical protein